MKKVTFQNGKQSNTLAIGLYWANIAGSKPKAELATLSKELNKSFSLLRRIKKNGESDTYQVALTEEKELSGLISGAAVIASKFNDLIFVEKINIEQSWIVAISDGEIIVGLDKIVPGEELQSELESIRNNFEEDPVIVISPNVIEENWLNEDISDEILTFTELMNKAGVEKISKEFSSLKLSGGQSNSRTLLLGLVAIGMLGAGAYQAGLIPGMNQAAPIVYQELPPVTNVVEQVIPKKSEPNDQQILEMAYQEEVSWLRNDFNINNASSTIKRVLAFDIVMQKYINGWQATQIDYNESNPQYLEIKWKREEIGTPLSLRAGIGKLSNIDIDLNGYSASSFHNVVDEYDRGYDDIDIVRFIRNTKYKHEHLMHDLISMNYVWKMTHHEQTERPKKILGLKKRASEKTRQLVSEIKNVQIGGTSRDELSALIKVIDSAPTFKLKNISINLDAGFQWTVDGVLYEN